MKMAKKSDILSLYNNQFSELDNSYKTRLINLERAYLHAKRFDDEALKKDIEAYEKIENDLRDKFIEIERKHHENSLLIEDEYKERFEFLGKEKVDHEHDTNLLFDEENSKYEEILAQFEERKSEAFNTYMRLTKEANYSIERETRVHSEFVNAENDRLAKTKEGYQKLNSNLSNQLLWTMEKAKNALEKLNNGLKEKSKSDIVLLNDTIMESLTKLRGIHSELSQMFYKTTHELEHERDRIRNISKEKRKPHSDLNQEMIHDFLKKIRDINMKRVEFEQMINSDLKNSLAILYPKLIEADANDDQTELHKCILQKEIIEKKAKYLLYRNRSISDSLIAKYQNEIKKIKIDSFKRYEEIKLAYEMPASFFQNSVNLYSNFNFYINETFNELDNILMDLIKYNQNYTQIKANYITGSSKVVEDYKINLMVRVNDLTNKMTDYITSIDEISNKIVTLESNNRLEVAEVKKKMENLEIQGDLQKYLASLEHDEYLAMFQHNKNIEKIQIEANYKFNLLNINTEVLMLNKNKQQLEEYKNYLIQVATLEKEIQEKSYEKRLLEAQIYYKQQKTLSDLTMQLIKTRLSYQKKKENHYLAGKFFAMLDEEKDKEAIASDGVIDFIHHMQNLIDLNKVQTEKINKIITSAADREGFISVLITNRDKLTEEITELTKNKIKTSEEAIKLYTEEHIKIQAKVTKIIDKHITMLMQLILLNEADAGIDKEYILRANGYLSEFVAVVKYAYNQVKEYAYKYQIPDIIRKSEALYEKAIFELVVLNTRQIDSFRKTSRTKKQAYTLKTYYIKSLEILKSFRKDLRQMLLTIKHRVTKNDELFIAKAMRNDALNKKVIRKEFKKLIEKAKNRGFAKEKQLNHFREQADHLNSIFTEKVESINNEFEMNKSANTLLLTELKQEITKIVKRNDEELLKILRYVDDLYVKDSFQLDRQYQRYIKTFKRIQRKNRFSSDDEIDYIETLYNSRVKEAEDTIAILDERIDALPAKKAENYELIAKEKGEVIKTKRLELMRYFANVEKEKFVSRPEYLKQIERIQKRLPDDYLDLYKRIQSLENDYIKQYSSINSDYIENYKNFLESQKKYQETLSKHSLIYKPFEDIKKYNENVLKTTETLYRDTVNKSKEARDKMTSEKQKSKEKQNRIINA